MPGRRVRLTVVGAVVAASVLPVAPITAPPPQGGVLAAGPTVGGVFGDLTTRVRAGVGETHAQPLAVGPVAAQRRAPAGCDNDMEVAEPVASLPWAQQRYAPDRLATLATGAGVTVAVIDSGVNDTHAQMKGRVLSGNDYLDPGSNGKRDCRGHGTGVASIIAAGPVNGVEFHGLAPKAKILPVRVSEQVIIEGKEDGANVSAAKFAESIRWAVRNGADVINLSLVYYSDDAALRSAIAFAIANDVVVVAAAGNMFKEGNRRPYPAAYEGVLGVGAVDENGLRAEFSQVGDYVDLVAPGSKVLAAWPGRGHLPKDGTSFAAPFVSATAALVREYWPDMPAQEVVKRIIATTDPAPGGQGTAYGSGILNPYRAVTETVANQRRPPAAALPPDVPDPGAVARDERRSAARERALWVAGIAGGVAGSALLLALVLPAGMRRRWRPAGPA